MRGESGNPRHAGPSPEIWLRRNLYHARGALTLVAPWIATLLVTMALSAVFSSIERFREQGQWLVIGLGVGGLIVTVVRSLRMNAPTLQLHLLPDSVKLSGRDGRERARASWDTVRAVRSQYQIKTRGTSTWLPVVELKLGDLPVLTICGWDPLPTSDPGWQTTTTPSEWLVYAAGWRQLNEALKKRGLLCKPPPT
jgi:hypothetical protein